MGFTNFAHKCLFSGAGGLSSPGAGASPGAASPRPPSLLSGAPGPTTARLCVMGCRAESTHILTEIANNKT